MLPANVLTVAIILTLSLLVTANDTAFKFPLVDSTPISPQDSTTLDGDVSLNKEALHFTQEETVKDEEPLGRVEKSDVERYELFDKTSATYGNEDVLVKDIPPLLFTRVENAETPSFVDPER